MVDTAGELIRSANVFNQIRLMNSYGFSFSARLLFLFPLIFSNFLLTAQEKTGGFHELYGNMLLEENLEAHVWALSADSMLGRETGEPGSILAGNYIEDFFIELGLPPIGDTTYRQTMRFTWLRWGENEVIVNGDTLRNRWQYLAVPADNFEWENYEIDEIVFMGFGIDDERYSDRPEGDFEGKVALVISGEPIDEHGNSVLTDSSDLSDWGIGIEMKRNYLSDLGFKQIIVAETSMGPINRANWRRMTRPLSYTSPTQPEESLAGLIYMDLEVAYSLIGDFAEEVKEVFRVDEAKMSSLSGQSVEVDLEINLRKKFQTLEDDNILGYIEGIDPVLKDELIVVSAHYDHIGYRGDDIFNGANDNASGTSAVMEMARPLLEAKNAGHGPARSVLLILLTGEEKGLLGSSFYVENPIFPLENTIANINIDMLGRVDEKHRDLGIENYVYPIGSDRMSTSLHEKMLMVNENYSHIHLDLTYNDPEDPNRYYFRSDHYNFVRKGIPAIFYFNGMNEDYHLATDTADKMNFSSMTAATRHIFHLVWELANSSNRLERDVFDD